MPADPFAALERARRAGPDSRVARRILPLLDLTSLRGDESDGEVERLARRAVAAGCAALCVFPRYLPAARPVLAGTPVRLATVVNFPEGGDDLVRVREEVREAVALGAQEVDAVAPLQAARDGDLELVGDLVRACREETGPDVLLKVILETGWLAEPALVTAAARAAVMAGAHFLKTSTGRREPGATLEAAALLLAVIAEAEGRVGLKVSGGIRTVADAAPYLALAEEVMGEEWVVPGHLRFGTSRLLDDVEARLGGRGGRGGADTGNRRPQT